MPLVLRQPNPDRQHLTHLFFDTGDGRMLTFFVDEEQDSGDVPNPEPGQDHHLAFRTDGNHIGESADALEAAGYPVMEFDRGAFHSLYTADNNDHGVELVADKFDLPDDRRGQVFTLAQQLRVDGGADFVWAEHVRGAVHQLGPDVEDRKIRDAEAGGDV